jgi:hypothetical protein
MRLLLAFMMLSSTVAVAQEPVTAITTANPHISLRALVDPEVVTAGGEVTLTFEITPGRRIHVYAPGADYQVVALKLDAQPGLKFKDVKYPPSEIYHFEPLDERVPVYSKPFVLKQDVTVGAAALKGKDALTLSGKLEYQACDDRVCFKPATVPFKFVLRAKR